MKGPEKTLADRRSSLDAEIDSLTSILADLESSSPYKPRPAQNLTQPENLTRPEWFWARYHRHRSHTFPLCCRRCVGVIGGYAVDLLDSSPDGDEESQQHDCQIRLTRSRASPSDLVDLTLLRTPPSGSRPGLASHLEDSMLTQRRTSIGSACFHSSSVPAAASPSAPVTGYKRMVIPTQPPLTATLKSSPKPQASPYVRSAQPGPQHQAPGGPQHYAPQPQPGRPAPPGQVHYMPAQPKGPDFAYGPPQPGFTPVGHGGYQDQHYPGGYQDQPYPGGYQDQPYPGGYQDQPYPGPGQQNAWRPEAAPPAQAYQPPQAPRKTFINDPPPSLAPLYGTEPMGPPKGVPAGGRPEDELDRLTKKMLMDMEHPPTEEYFGRCAMCEENVMGEGSGCTAMDQVFHVDCFVCRTCSSKLRGKPFYAVEKKAYCEHCYI
ncbi:hypothetical protein NHX12_033532, partial [Muraenolepis orangiensis]